MVPNDSGRLDMRRSRFETREKLAAVQAHRAGTSVAQVCRRYGISAATFFRWKKQLAVAYGESVDRVAALERTIADQRRTIEAQARDLEALKRVLRGKR